MKAANDGLAQVINHPHEQEISEKLEAFQNLILLLRWVEGRGRGESVNFTHEGLSDYSESKLQKVDYLNLRKEVKQ